MRDNTSRSLNAERMGMILFPSQRNGGRPGAPRKTLVHIGFIRDGMADGFSFERQLHQFLELRADHAQISVGHPVRRVLHDEPQYVRVLIEELAP